MGMDNRDGCPCPYFIFSNRAVTHGYVCTAYRRDAAIARDVTSDLNRKRRAGLILPISRYQ